MFRLLYYYKGAKPLFQTVIDTMLFEGIDIEDEEFVLSKFTKRSIPKHHVIFFQDDPGNEMYIIKSGLLKIYREDDSKEIILGHQFPGQMIGELEVIHHNNHRLASVSAIEPSVLWMINKVDLEILITIYPELLRKIFYVVSERLQQADRKLEYLAFLDARIRLVNLLLDLHSNFGIETERGYLINWKITQQHLANMIGIGRESAARTLQDLQEDKIILLENKLITIIDLPVLQRLAKQKHETDGHRHWHSSYKYNIQ
jgi:CRP/FNR family transcriptional regulator, cyclic AMP receptor protein